jgi:hypothetical protein
MECTFNLQLAYIEFVVCLPKCHIMLLTHPLALIDHPQISSSVLDLNYECTSQVGDETIDFYSVRYVSFSCHRRAAQSNVPPHPPHLPHLVYTT